LQTLDKASGAGSSTSADPLSSLQDEVRDLQQRLNPSSMFGLRPSHFSEEKIHKLRSDVASLSQHLRLLSHHLAPEQINTLEAEFSIQKATVQNLFTARKHQRVTLVRRPHMAAYIQTQQEDITNLHASFTNSCSGN
jgi:hypothetical protein